MKKDWSKLSWRETWDFVDTAYFHMDMDLEEFLRFIGLDESEYFNRRKNQKRVPEHALEKLWDKAPQGSD